MSDIKIKNIYALTPLQEGMLFHAQYETESNAYFEQVRFTVEECLKPDLLEQSFNRLIERYDVMRTVFIDKETERPLQVVLEKRETNIHFEDVSALSNEESAARIDAYMTAERAKPFNLSKDILIRMAVFQTGAAQCKIVWSFHHIVMDGWCLGILVKELFQIYQSLATGTQARLADVYPYSIYFEWLDRQDKEAAFRHWDATLQGYEAQAVIPSVKNTAANEGYEYRKQTFLIDETTTKAMEKLAVDQRVTLSSVFHVIWGILLQKYNQLDDVVFGSVVSGRPPEIPGIESMIGLFINTVPIRISGGKDTRISAMLTDVHRSMLDANSYGYLSLADIQSRTSLKNQLIQNIVVFENYPMEQAFTGDEGAAKIPAIQDVEFVEFTNYDLSVAATPGREFEVVTIYNGVKYDEAFMTRLGGHLAQIAKQITTDPAVTVDQIALVTEAEKRQILVDFQPAPSAYPHTALLHQLFEEQVAKTPDAIALVCRDQQLTYAELDQQANAVARFLRAQGVGPDKIVGILMERSIEFLISVFGILKAGGAFLPFDSTNPGGRIEYMLGDSGLSVLLTHKGLGQRFASETIQRVEWEQIDWSAWSTSQLEVTETAPEHLAYVLYTSGSTGNPKGVMIEHRTIVNQIWHLKQGYGHDEAQQIWVANPVFDASMEQIFSPLFNGKCLHIPDDATRTDYRELWNYIERNGIGTINVVPALMDAMLDHLDKRLSLRSVLLGGEAFTPALYEKLRTKLKIQEIVNLYGPTEASVNATSYVMGTETVTSIPIGKPVPNYKLYILDEGRQLLPVGVAGELYIGGEGLARGYLNRDELTEEFFVPNPFEPGERMYRTKDVVRWLPDGNIEYLGRLDHQVKIRGLRIELGEIETAIAKHHAVKEVLVHVIENRNGDKSLCAYLIAASDLDERDLKTHLADLLPTYMIPTFYVQLDAFPLSPAGKVDRKNLPAPDFSAGADERVTLPRNATEDKLLQIWQDILQLGRIGIEEDFFLLGGHSLKAATLSTRIHKELGKEMPIREIFARPTIAELSAYLDREESSLSKPIQAVAKQPHYPASSAQKRLYVLNLLEDQAGLSYNMPAVYRIAGELDAERLHRALQALIERHDIFRTSFQTVDGEIMQVVADDVEFDLQVTDLRGEAEGQVEAITDGFVRAFDLERAPLMRAEVLQTGDAEYVLLIDVHHIISDGVSSGIMTRELTELYEGRQLPGLTLQYKDYAAWQQAMFQSDAMQKQEQYWLERFAGEIPVLNLPLDYKRPVIQSFAGKTVRFTASEAVAAGLSRVATQTKTTLFMVLLAAYNVLLMRYTGQKDLVVGSPVAGRNHHDVQDMLGMFVNTVALRNYPRGELTFRAFLNEVTASTLEALDHQDYPFEQLVEKLEVRRDTSRNPLFDTMFSWFEAEKQELHVEGVTFTSQPLEHDIAKFDLMLDAAFTADGQLVFDLQYCTDLFRDQTAERMAAHFLRILEQAAADPYLTLADFDMLTAEETVELTQTFNSKTGAYDFSATIAERFERYASETPEKTALIFNGAKTGYAELNRRANQIGAFLHGSGLAVESVVAVMLERTPAFVESVLGVWKSGGAYVPLDTAYGAGRVLNILEDSEAAFLITRSEHLDDEIKQQYKGQIVCLDLLEQELQNQPTSDLGLPSDINRLAYILFTSGSTGKPKGVMIEHLGLLNHVLAEADELGLDEKLVFAQNANQCFDISVWQFFGALALGGTTVIYPQEMVLDVPRLTDSLVRDGVTLLEVVPSYLAVMMDHIEAQHLQLPALRHLMITGETVKPGMVQRWFQLCPQIAMVNAYGPAEASDDVSQYTMTEAPPQDMHNVPIGTPVPNFRLYVVDEAMKLCPVGVIGEICVAGIGVGRGYINRPDLTERSFMQDPFAPELNQRLYKTGDLGRWLPDGNLEFAIRRDFQVKIRGFRIELEEIEAVLLKQPEVRQAVVVAKEVAAGSPMLCAYLVADETLDVQQLKRELGYELPDYMIPPYIVLLEVMPLLVSGKINRKALPEPDAGAVEGTAYAAPENELEELLAQVWEDVLGVKPIGRDHNFFELGGDSIKAIQISSKLHNEGYAMKMKDLFQNPQISRLVKQVKKERREIEQGLITGEVAWTPIQQWFFEAVLTDQHHYNQAVMLYKEDRFDAEILKHVLAKVTEHHDALRMVFREEAGRLVQVNRGVETESFELTVLDVRAEADPQAAIARAVDQLQGSFDLARGPLVKLGLFQTAEGDHLAIIVHHLVIDGVSWRILFEDVTTAYGQVQSGEPIQFPAKTDSFKVWAEQLNEYAASRELLAEIPFWSRIENAQVKPLAKQGADLKKAVKDNQRHTFRMSAEDTDSLLGRTNTAYSTEINDILLTALGAAVQRWTGDDQVLICLEGHGREEVVKDVNINRTVGWFTSEYPILLDMSHADDLGYQIKRVKEDLRKIPNKGMGYGILRYLTPAAQRGAVTFGLEPEIKFNYFGQFDGDVNTGLFAVSPFGHGQTVSPEAEREVPLYISGLVENGELILSIDYNTLEFAAADIVELGGHLQSSLAAIIEHCAAKETKELTPSDVGGDDLSIEELEAIAAFYEE